MSKRTSTRLTQRMNEQAPRPWRGDLRWGVRLGLYTAGVYAIVAGALLVAPLYQGHVSLLDLAAILLGYLTAGVCGGAIVGILRRFNGTWVGIAGIGAAAGIPVFFALETVLFGSPLRWDLNEWLTYATSVLLVGPFAAIVYRYQSLRE